MLNRLTFTVTFASTGKVLSRSVDFTSGFTAISGPNESGKSTIIEMIRFALFGTPALRGPIKSLKSYDVELVFTLKDQEWKVTRQPGKASLVLDGETVVSGVSPVDARIAQMFGYGLNVFDIANNCQQGKVEALTEMRGAERKRIVDKVIGFDILDKLQEFVAEKAAEARGELKGINPVEPVAPDTPTRLVQQSEIDALEPLARELAEIRGWLSVPRSEPRAPAPAEPCEKAEVDAYDRLRRERNEIAAKLAGIPEPSYTTEQLNEMVAAWVRYAEYNDFVRQHGPCPDQTPEEIEALMAAMERGQLWANKRELLARIAAAQRVTCPDCGSSFPLHQEHVRKLEKELEQYADVEEASEIDGDQDELERLLERARAWASRPDVRVERPELDERQIALQRQALALAHLRPLPELPPDPTPRYRAWLSYQDQRHRYEEDHASFSAYLAEKETRILRMLEIQHVESDLATLRQQRKITLEYEAKLAAYEDAKQRYVTDLAHKEEAEARLTQFENAAKGLKLLRSRIKMYLVPSLNRAASLLMQQMTGGQRNAIIIDESFEEILVDGQPIETLSGSAKAVANLAIRIGLGQVLTNRTFSVFMGDELDASMDQDRANFTADCLRALTQTISQVLVVSHKAIEADHHVRLAA